MAKLIEKKITLGRIYQISSQPQYSYSQQAIDFIFDQLCKAPKTILEDMKNKKMSTPGA